MKLFVEGGGDAKALRSKCRQGFSQFLEKAGFKGHMPRIVASGTRNKAYSDFCTALANGERAFLLVDSEIAVPPNATAWDFLRHSEDNWDQPSGAHNDLCHLMVQCMESWFVADRQTLQDFFGEGLQHSGLPNIDHGIESIRKKDVLKALEKATKDSKKGQYGKGRHSFDILAQIQPEKVLKASPWAKCFVERLNGAMKQ